LTSPGIASVVLALVRSSALVVSALLVASTGVVVVASAATVVVRLVVGVGGAIFVGVVLMVIVVVVATSVASTAAASLVVVILVIVSSASSSPPIVAVVAPPSLRVIVVLRRMAKRIEVSLSIVPDLLTDLSHVLFARLSIIGATQIVEETITSWLFRFSFHLLCVFCLVLRADLGLVFFWLVFAYLLHWLMLLLILSKFSLLGKVEVLLVLLL
jgi:hypothetical protein